MELIGKGRGMLEIPCSLAFPLPQRQMIPQKNTNKQQIDTKIFTSKHKVREYIGYARGTAWHLYNCYVESEMWPKIKQIMLKHEMKNY